MNTFGIQMEAAYVGLVTEGDWQAFAWDVTLTRGAQSYTTRYRMGTGNSKPATGNESASELVVQVEGEARLPDRPTLIGVLYSLQSDASALDASSFEDWAADYGYDSDSRKAEKIYHACLDVGHAMRQLLGADFEAFRAEEYDA